MTPQTMAAAQPPTYPGYQYPAAAAIQPAAAVPPVAPTSQPVGKLFTVAFFHWGQLVESVSFLLIDQLYSVNNMAV